MLYVPHALDFISDLVLYANNLQNIIGIIHEALYRIFSDCFF
ncbi:hypothetical protein TPHV1_190037 [Treponema phagedenis]|uniref:Uncharacterized protein n=1 Tax=Treponema phagedenis TaxID=162 RepID=A0A0B7GWT6_TREPH|nr:hypothetical protein TPHV1_190037 [Treponema phagedenis]